MYNEKFFPKDLLEGFELPQVKEEVTDKTAAAKEDIDGWLRANNEYYGDPKLMGKEAVAKKLTEGFRLRDQLFVLILADTAIRPVEATRILMDQVQSDDLGTYIVLTKFQTKNGHGRKIYLSKTTVELALKPFLNWRTAHKVNSPYLLPQGNSDRPLDASKWRRQFQKKVNYAQKREYMPPDKHITPYSLKRYAVAAMDRVSVAASRAITGHVGDSNDVHGLYNQEVDSTTLNDRDRIQQEIFVRTMHEKAGTVSGLKYIQG